MMKRLTLLPFLLVLSFVLRAQEAIVPGDLLVMLKPGASVEKLANDLQRLNGTATDLRVVQEISAPMRAWLLHFDADIPQAVMRRAVQAHPSVMIAQDNHRVKDRTVPNDTQYGQQWHHQNIDSEAAWDITTGGVTATGDTIVVCIIENADLPHPDLVANAWFNRHEIPNNDIDDDGNGYVDDYRGWSPPAGNDNVYGGGHGTQVAGMIGAVGDNGSQVVGANWHVKMMVVPYGGAQEAQVIAAYTYPLVMRRLYNASGGTKGAFVVATNASWGIDGGQPEDAPLWCAMYDTLGTAGILNCGATANNAVNVDVVGDLPTACASDFMVSVTATNANDQRTFSAYGATTIDVGAPGSDVVTTAQGGGISSTSGTSFASPLTAGVIGLLYSVPCPGLMALVYGDPKEGALHVRQALFNGVEQVGNLPGNTVTGGRINSYNSLMWLMDNCSDCPVPFNLNTSSNVIGDATLAWGGTSDTYNIRYRQVGAPSWIALNNVVGNSTSVSDIAVCTAYEFQAAPICEGTSGDFSASYTWTSEGCCTAPLQISATALGENGATVQWASVLAAGTYSLRHRQAGSTDWTQVDVLTGNSTTLVLEPCSDNEIQMRSTCSGGTNADWSASIMVHVPGCGQCVEGDFCESMGDAGVEWIERVRVGSIDNESGSDDGYANNSDQTTVLVIGEPYTITLTPGFQGNTYSEYFTVWMDLDHDDAFTAPNERVFDAGATSESEVTGTLTVPDDALPGSVRMRVVMSYDGAVNNGCSGYDFGETEDYCVSLWASVGVQDIDARNAGAVFPNPADASVTLVADGPAEVLVLDGAGRQVTRRSLVNGRLTLSTTDWDQGLYLYRILRNGSEQATGRFVVSH